ncbi:hypothetical protein EDB85DRAFT_1916865, partial [Lactarius pseudohatsudake]
MRGLYLLGQRAMTLCRGALGLSDPTWYIRLPPVSEDKGQYSMPRGRQSQAVSSGFEPAKHSTARPLRPDGLVAIGASVSGEEGGFLLGLYGQPASAALALRALRAAKTGNPFQCPGCSSTP